MADEQNPYLIAAANAARRIERDISELLGLAKGMLADGVVHQDEASYLQQWLTLHPDAASRWPAKMLLTRLDGFFRDGRIDEAERIELAGLLDDLVGGRAQVSLGYEAATALPLDRPSPLICWGPDEVYVFTGRFAYGTRAHCQREVTGRQSKVEDGVTRRTSFLVIGTFTEENWAHSSYGRKIERAVELRDSGFPLRIVGEDHWAQSLR